MKGYEKDKKFKEWLGEFQYANPDMKGHPKVDARLATIDLDRTYSDFKKGKRIIYEKVQEQEDSANANVSEVLGKFR